MRPFFQRPKSDAKTNVVKLFIMCPLTDRPAYTGLSLTRDMFERLDLSHNIFLCPNYGKPHIWKREDILEDMLDPA